MKLSFDTEELAFRDQVRAFIATHFPADQPFRPGTPDEDRWAAALLAQGWAAYQWPEQWGGTGWDMTHKYIWERETALAGVGVSRRGIWRVDSLAIGREGSNCKTGGNLAKGASSG